MENPGSHLVVLREPFIDLIYKEQKEQDVGQEKDAVTEPKRHPLVTGGEPVTPD